MSEQYFAAEPSSGHRPGSVHVILPDLHLELDTDAGVFSPRRLDPGTRLLLDVAPPPPAAGDLLEAGPAPRDLLADKGFNGRAFAASQAARGTAVLVPPDKKQRAAMPSILLLGCLTEA